MIGGRTTSGLEGRGVRLRPYFSGDFDFVSGLASWPSSGAPWRFRGATLSPQQLQTALWDGVHCQYVVERTANGTPLGLVGLYRFSFMNRNAFCFAVLADYAQGFGFGPVAVALLLRMSVPMWSLRKVYFEAPEYNLGSIGGRLDRFVTEEARLHEFEYFFGRAWDLITCSMSPEQVEAYCSAVGVPVAEAS